MAKQGSRRVWRTSGPAVVRRLIAAVAVSALAGTGLALAGADPARAVAPYTVTFHDTDGDMNWSQDSVTRTDPATGAVFTFTGLSGLGLGIASSEGLEADADNGGAQLTVSVQSGYTFDLSDVLTAAVPVFGGPVTLTLTATSGLAQSAPITTTVPADGNGRPLSGLSPAVGPLDDITKVVLQTNDFALFQDFQLTDIKPAVAPTVTAANISLSGASGNGGAFKIGDTVTARWNNTSTGDNNPGVTGVTMDLSQFGGGSSVAASNSGDLWTASTMVGNAIEATNRNVSVSATSAGGTTTVAGTTNATVDTRAPATTFTNVALSADTGISGTDFITNVAAQTIIATLSAPLSWGDVVDGSLDGGATWTDITGTVSGTTLAWNGVTLSAGTSTLMLRVTDAAGNRGSTYGLSYTLDTTAPTTTAISVSFSNDSGASSTDFITNVAAQTVSGLLSANLATGETVYVSLNNGATWTAATAAVGSNAWALAGVILTGSNTLRVKVTDAAGNDGTALSQAFVYDTTAPTTIVASVSFSADSGTSSSDLITKVAAQTVSGTLSANLASDETVYVSLNNGATWTAATAAVGSNAWALTGVTLTGSDILCVKVTDAAGNDGTMLTRAYVYDTTAPTLSISASTGSAALKVGETATITFTFSKDPGTSFSVSGVTVTGGTLGALSGTGTTRIATFTPAAGTDGGTGSVSVGAGNYTDAAGNSGAGATLFLSYDTSAPSVVSVSVPANGTYYTGQSLDFTVSLSEPVTVDTSGGTPQIALVIGSTTRYASYVSGSSTSALVFRYVVGSSDNDADGITIGSLSANGGTLRDAAGNDAALTLNSVGSTADVLVQSTLPQVVAFDADAPTAATVGGPLWTPSASPIGPASSSPVVYAVDPATDGFGDVSAQACSLVAGAVRFDHAGDCVIVAGKAGDGAVWADAATVRQTVTVAPAAQATGFDSAVPSPAYPGGHATLLAHDGGSGNAVSYSSTTGTICTVSGDEVTFVLPGTCTVQAEQAAGRDYLAGSVTQDIAVVAVPATVSVVPSAVTTTYGQPVTATATVTPALGQAGGSVQFTVDGVDVGTAVPVMGGTATSGDLELGAAGDHTVSAVYTPTDTTTAAPASSPDQTVTVIRADTSVAVQATGSQLTATVTATAPGAGMPTGSVELRVGVVSVGTVALSGGAATLDVTLPAAPATVSATYLGDADFNASSGTTSWGGIPSTPEPVDPTVEVSVQSSAPAVNGWYHGPVRLVFACTAGSAPLSDACPAPVTLGEGAGQQVTRTVLADDGGITTVTFGPFNVDATAPVVRLVGVPTGAELVTRQAQVRCAATDALSRVADCQVRTVTGQGTVTYVATAHDRAGNATTVRQEVQVRQQAYAIAGAASRNGALVLRRGQIYLLVVLGPKRPRLLGAVRAPRRPHDLGGWFYRAGSVAGVRRWTVAITPSPQMSRGTAWNLGIRSDGHTRVIHTRIR